MTRPRTHRQTPPLTPLRRAWLIFALTGLGCCVGVLTLLYGAAAYIKLPGLALFRSYFHHPALLGLNLLNQEQSGLTWMLLMAACMGTMLAMIVCCCKLKLMKAGYIWAPFWAAFCPAWPWPW